MKCVEVSCSALLKKERFQMRIFFILLISLSLLACVTDNTENATLIGTVTCNLQDVTVAVYAQTALDTTLVRINREFPHIGIQISQETEFDHRMQSPVTMTKTDVLGEYKIDKVKPGRYNLVFLKEGYSLKYVYEVNLTEGENVLEPQELLPCVDVSATITEPMTFMSGVQYNFSQDTQIMSPVYIEAGAILSIAKEKKVDFYGNVQTAETGARWQLTSSSYLNEIANTPPDSTDYFNCVIIHAYNNNQTNLQNGIVSFINAGISIDPANSVYANMRAKYGFAHANIHSMNHQFYNNLISNFTQRAHVFYGSSLIEKNVFYNNIENMLLSENEVALQYNYFANNFVALRTFYGDIHITHNNFSNNSYCISTVASAPLIEYNDFFGSKQYCIQTHKYYTQAAYDFSKPLISNNNFFGNNVSISLIAKSNIYSQGFNYYSLNGLGVRSDIFATNNYYKQHPIDDRIIDHNDYSDPNSPNYCPYNVIFEPYSSRVIGNAGIN
jgi:hypothetical protein